MSAYFAIPSSAGTIKQVSRLAVWTSDDDSTYQLTALWPGAAQSWASGGKEFVVPFVTKRKYAKTEVLIVGTTGTQSFGVAKIGFTLQVGYDWSRAKSFE